MSRSGYTFDTDPQELNCYRGAVASATRGARGQAFLREMLAALDALPVKQLIAGDLESKGKVCAIGAVGRARGMDMSKINPHEPTDVAYFFGIAHALACEIAYENDEGLDCRDESETQAERYARVRRWVVSQLR